MGPRQLSWDAVLGQLLLSAEVEIGIAKSVSANYVEFVAWKGEVSERVARAVKRVESISGPDREFCVLR